MNIETPREELHALMKSMFEKKMFMETIEQISDQDKSKEFDKYFLTKVYPALVDGMESLSREVEFWMESDRDPTVTKRFNPCFYLAQFLMRNNPKYLNNMERYEKNGIWERELKRRLLIKFRAKILSAVDKKMGGDSWDIKKVTLLYIKIDEMFEEEGRLQKASISLPETRKALEVSTEFDVGLLFDDLIVYFNGQEDVKPEQLEEKLERLFKQVVQG